jgi:DNA mismatch endonuclease (patch repair protein)
MADRMTPAQRSRNMARIRGAHTLPERTLRSALHRAGFRFRLQRRDLPGRPDIVLRRYSAVIFVHGCFWHRHTGCSNATLPKTRAKFWADKLNTNRRRDGQQIRLLLHDHWRVLVVWECALRKPAERDAVAASAIAWIRRKSVFCEIPRRPEAESRFP